MAKVVGFNQEIADNQERLKREGQRKASLSAKSNNIHFKKGGTDEKVNTSAFESLKSIRKQCK